MPVLVEDAEEAVAAADIIQQLRKGKKVHDQFAKQFRSQYLIAGKVISDWQEHFKIELPPDLNPQLAQSVDARLMELHQEATFLRAEAEARFTAYKSAKDGKYREKYAALVAEYKESGQKLPAKDTLEALETDSISSMTSGLTHAEMEMNFWKNILDDLRNSRRLLESATITMATEAKALSNEKYIDFLSKKNGEG